MIERIELPSFLDEPPLGGELEARLSELRARIESFQDRWEEHKIEQFVAADYEMVFHALTWLGGHQISIGRRFLEWGCGFAVVSCLADDLGWNAYAVEAHADLIPHAEKTIASWPAAVELFAGNFLPRCAEELADDPTLPSLGHGGENAYQAWEVDLDDFALVYSYPWPGEDEFHARVFDTYAAVGAMLLMFIGPNEMRLIRKVK